jgi:hypothetical protein
MRLRDRLRLRVDDWRIASGRSDGIGRVECHLRLGLASKHALKQRRGVGEPARAREARGFEHYVRIGHVIHVRSFLLLGNNRASV